MRNKIVFAILTMAFLLNADAQQRREYIPETDPLVLKKLDQWQGIKFGLLMHWGTYSQWGIVESWSICAEDEGWCARKMDNYIEYKKKYEDLIKTFNPVKFNPDKWAAAAKDAGMRYVVFTTKHHDGFSMFDTKQSEYRITGKDSAFRASPRANVTKEVFDAFRKQGMMTGAYFSKPDWHSEYYWWPNFATPDRNVNYSIKHYPERWQNFVKFTHNQIDELMTDYGKVDILWLDGGWVRIKTDQEIRTAIESVDYAARPQSQDIDMPGLVKSARAKQPGLIVVDREVPGPYQNYLTPENQVPAKTLPYPWETCMPMATSWSYVHNDKYKSPHQLIGLLVDIVSKGGNFLLNIGPSPEGDWDDDAYDRLKHIGEWMKVNSEAIYETHPLAPYKEGKVSLTQLKDGTTYAIYVGENDEKSPPAKIWFSHLSPAANATISMLGTNRNLKWESVGKGFAVDIPDEIRKNPPCDHAWVLKISQVQK